MILQQKLIERNRIASVSHVETKMRRLIRYKAYTANVHEKQLTTKYNWL